MREQQLKIQVEIQSRINGYEDKDNLPPFSKRKIAAALLIMGGGLTGFVHAISDTSFGGTILTGDSYSSKDQIVNVAPTGFDKVKANAFEESFHVQNESIEQVESEQVFVVDDVDDAILKENIEPAITQTFDSLTTLEEESIVNAQTVVVESADESQLDLNTVPTSEQSEISQIVEYEQEEKPSVYKNALANNANTDVYDAYNTDNTPQPVAVKSNIRAKQEAMLAANDDENVKDLDDEIIDNNNVDDELGLAIEHSETDLATDGSGPVSGSVNEFNESVSSDTIKRLILTRGIADKEPKEESAKHIDSQVNTFNLFLFTELNGYTGGEVTHRWIWSDKVVAEINLKVGEGKFRTWSSKRILWRWQGNWRVEVLDNNGNVMKVKYFSYGL